MGVSEIPRDIGGDLVHMIPAVMVAGLVDDIANRDSASIVEPNANIVALAGLGGGGGHGFLSVGWAVREL
jgi:hypothetical protein